MNVEDKIAIQELNNQAAIDKQLAGYDRWRTPEGNQPDRHERPFAWL